MINKDAKNRVIFEFIFLNFEIRHETKYSLIKECLQRGLNSRPLVYKTSALPLSYEGYYKYDSTTRKEHYIIATCRNNIFAAVV